MINITASYQLNVSDDSFVSIKQQEDSKTLKIENILGLKH